MTAGDEMKGFTIGQLLDRAIRLYPNRIAYIFQEEQFTFSAVGHEVAAVERGLIAAGVRRGDRVAVWLPNCLEWIWIYLAAARIGAVLVPVNTNLLASEAAYIVGHSEAVMLITTDTFRGTDYLRQASEVLAHESVCVETLVIADGDSTDNHVVTFDALLAGGADVTEADLVARRSGVDADDLAMLLYTSGTTGFPKGAMHSHKVVRNMSDAAERMELSNEDHIVMYLPLFHVFAAAAVLSFMWAGGAMTLMRYFDPAMSLALMESNRASVVYGMPTTYLDQLGHPDFDARNLSRIRLCVVPGPQDFVLQVEEKFGLSINVYGMTETTSMTTLPRPSDSSNLRTGTQGTPLPGFEAKVVDESGRECAHGAVGELVVRGHPVMLGYYKRPVETAEVLTDDGWFRTGDAFESTGAGYYHYRGRIKEMYKVGGENVDPLEVEIVLSRHPGVAMVAVAGVPHPRLDEVGVAFILPSPDAETSEADVLAYAKQNLARFKVPRRIVFVEGFPKTGSGKIQKYRLIETYKDEIREL